MINIDCTHNLNFLQSKYQGKFLDFFNAFLIRQQCFNFCNISARKINQRFNELSQFPDKDSNLEIKTIKHTEGKSKNIDNILLLSKLSTRIDSSNIKVPLENIKEEHDQSYDIKNQSSSGSQANMDKNRAILNNLYKYNTQKN